MAPNKHFEICIPLSTVVLYGISSKVQKTRLTSQISWTLVQIVERFYLIYELIWCILQHNLIREIGINPEGVEGHDPPDFRWGGCGSPWNIIISYNVQECEMRALSKSGDFSEIERFIYNYIKISKYDTLKPVLRASVCRIFRTRDTASFQTRTYDAPSFQTMTHDILSFHFSTLTIAGWCPDQRYLQCKRSSLSKKVLREQAGVTEPKSVG